MLRYRLRQDRIREVLAEHNLSITDAARRPYRLRIGDFGLRIGGRDVA